MSNKNGFQIQCHSAGCELVGCKVLLSLSSLLKQNLRHRFGLDFPESPSKEVLGEELKPDRSGRQKGVWGSLVMVGSSGRQCGLIPQRIHFSSTAVS